MADWYYYNESGAKIGPLGGRELKKLAQQGMITPETKVEDNEGRTAFARDVKGLQFTSTSTSNGNVHNSEPNYFYYDENGYKYGPVSVRQLKELAAQGVVNPNTPMETDTGHKGTAGQIPALFAAVPPSGVHKAPVPLPTPPLPAAKDVFCTNCGSAVSKQAVACMSCGAKPVGHRKFCRQCAAPLNPEQVVCTACGAEIKDTTSYAQAAQTQVQRVTGSTMSWLTDFAFNDIRIQRMNQSICRWGYVYSWIWIGLFTLAASVGLIFTLIGIIFIPVVLLIAVYFIYLARLYYERKIVEMDWKVETTKAALLYIEQTQGGSEMGDSLSITDSKYK